MCKLDGLEVASGCGNYVDWGKRKGCGVQKHRSSSLLWSLCALGTGQTRVMSPSGNSWEIAPLGSASNSWWNKVERGWGSGEAARTQAKARKLPGSLWLAIRGSAAAQNPKMSEVPDFARPVERSPQETAERSPGAEWMVSFLSLVFKGVIIRDLTLLHLSCLDSVSFSSFRRFPIIWGNSKHYFFLFYFSF